MSVVQFYKKFAHSSDALHRLRSIIQNSQDEKIEFTMESELCFNVGVNSPIDVECERKILWLLSEGTGCTGKHSSSFSRQTWLRKPKDIPTASSLLLEFGPRLNFASPFSSNAISIFRSVDVQNINRVEVSRRYLIFLVNAQNYFPRHTFEHFKSSVIDILHDRMTEVLYTESLASFRVDVTPDDVHIVDILQGGRQALEKVNKDLGLALDDWDIEYYTTLFRDTLKRNPTNVECFDLAQSNSEHSRHWFFKGKMTIDGVEKEKSLMELVASTQHFSNDNNVIKFSDNSSAIEGYVIDTLVPNKPFEASCFVKIPKKRHLLFTAETHNFPTGVAPFAGASTGTGGRIRDTHAAGRGSHVIAATAGYCFGNLRIPGYDLPWEDKDVIYPENLASPLDIAIQASNGASDYGNKFGEPVICGFARSFGMKNTVGGERREWIKPIMFSGGFGSIDHEHVKKFTPQKGMKVVKIGGPAYRIGVGGGAASSIQVQGDNTKELDFGAVQRGDPEMEQKLNRLIRACIEMGSGNPICSIHDQGAGGNGNVLKEICEPNGAIVEFDKFELGDSTLSLLEIWGAEYQESDAVLVHEKDVQLLKQIGDREKVPVCVVGNISDDGFIRFRGSSYGNCLEKNDVVDLPLNVVLGKMPQKIYHLETVATNVPPMKLSSSVNAREALDRVLRLPAVSSKRYLTNKVDRSVTGLVAQQQCVGPLGTPVADVAVIALSHFDTVGGATAIGEQPIKCMIDPCKGARLTVAEALTNLLFAPISDIKDIKCSANWMWPAKSYGEGAKLYNACEAMSTMLSSLGVAVDGGKDSLSMAARVNDDTVKSPGALVVSVYAPCPDIRKTITPDVKSAGNVLIYVKMTGGRAWRLGGSALAQVYKQFGGNVPDVDDVNYFSRCFCTIQNLVHNECLMSGHDVSDGGLVTTVLEMSFSGSAGIEVQLDELISPGQNAMDVLFSEEPGVVLEVHETQIDQVMHEFRKNEIIANKIGHVAKHYDIIITAVDDIVIQRPLVSLRMIWEATSLHLEHLQCNPECVADEAKLLETSIQEPTWNIPFSVGSLKSTPQNSANITRASPRVAILREEGSNGDREMVSSLHMVGFDVYDVTMYDLCNGKVDLSQFQGLVFVGGFSYADVFGSAKGWAALSKFNVKAAQQLHQFRVRADTFSLGVCNGCQLMALLGWVGSASDEEIHSAEPNPTVRFSRNKSGRFESRFVQVNVLESSSIMLKGMADLCMGIWIAHGEGRPHFVEDRIMNDVIDKGLAPIRYVNMSGLPTEQYPFNPNGAPQGIAGISSIDGRHLAMMPHPERSVLNWQLPWKPKNYKETFSPWLNMFQNAYVWCMQNKQ